MKNTVRSNVPVAVLSAVVLAWAACALAADGAGGSHPVRLFEERPGVFFYLFQDDALWENQVFSVEHHATADCVTPPVAMEISFPVVDGEGGSLELDINQTVPREEGRLAIPSECVGVSFFFKGDGSAGSARVELRADYPTSGPAVEIPLSDNTWRRVTLAWADFMPAGDIASVQSLAFGLADGSARPAHYTIDALEFVKTLADDPSTAALVQAANARRSEPDVPVREGPVGFVYNREGLRKARAKLRRAEGLKWLAYGDSVTVPVQLWNIPEPLRAQFSYYAVAAGNLEREFGSEIEIAINAVGGRQLSEDFQGLLDSLRAETPDVLVMLTGDTTANYRRLLPQVVETAAEVGAEILLVIPTYEASEYASPSYDWLRRWAVENDVAVADARRYLLAGDQATWGDTTANPNHPNPLGHRIIADVVAEMFR